MYDKQGVSVGESPQEFSNRLSLPFKDLLLLSRALTHRSYLNEHPEALEDNERLEFLGDAVLDYVVGLWLYNHFPEMAEGDLTRLRAALVKTDQLANFASQIGIGSALRLGRGEAQVAGLGEFQAAAQREAVDGGDGDEVRAFERAEHAVAYLGERLALGAIHVDHRGDVRAGDERLPLAGYDCDQDLAVAVQLRDNFLKLGENFVVEGVQRVRPVDANGRDRALFGNVDQCHNVSLFRLGLKDRLV